MVKSDFKLYYFSSFAVEESVVFHDLCEKLAKLDKKYSMNVFKFFPRVSSKDKKRWDIDFINEKLEKATDINKVYICGPTRFLTDIKQLLIDAKIVDNEKIHLV